MVKRFSILVGCFLWLSIFHNTFADDENWIIEPIETPADMLLLNGHQWKRCSELGESGKATQMAYVRGFWDALSYFNLACPTIDELRRDYHGMTLGQILDTINKFYADHPQWQNWPPATVMFYVIPRLRKGLSPTDSKLFEGEE